MMKNIFRMFAVLMVIGMATVTFGSIVDVPLDAQINIGRETFQSPTGNAIYWPIAGNVGSFPGDEAEGYARTNWINDPGSWQYGPYIDFYLAGATNDWVDLSAGGLIEFDTRVFNDPVTNTNPYGDANLFVRMYTYVDDGNPANGSYETYAGNMDFGLIYGPTGEAYYPDWTHITIDILNDPSSIAHANFDAGLLFDITKISRIRFYGTNWSGHGDDFVDVKNFQINAIPEPGTIAMFALGLLGLLATRRKK